MFKLHELKINNFRSYKGEHSFKFPDKKGLYFLTGVNEVQQNLASNGAGKSTFLDAITWVLYGRTARGLHANDVISWGASNCQASLELSVGSQTSIIKRAQKPNTLLLDGKPVDQVELEKYLRLNFEAFTYSVLNSQFGTSFFSLKPSAKLSLFSEIMNLNFWLTKSEEAAGLSKDLQVEINKLQNKISNQEGQLVTAEADIKVLEKQEKSFEAENDQQIVNCHLQARKIASEEEPLKIEIIQLRVDIGQWDYEIQVKKEICNNLTKIRDGYLTEIESINQEKSLFESKLEIYEEKLADLLKPQSHCPTCKQPLKKNIFGVADRDKIAQQISQIKRKIEYLSALAAQQVKAIINTKNKIDIKTSEIEDLQDTKHRHEQKLFKKELKLKNTSDRLDELTKKAEDLEIKENPFTKLLEDKHASIAKLRTQIKIAEDECFQLEEELIATDFWIKGFKRIRLFIIEQAFQSLEVEVNNSLAQLGMSDWQISFDIERENKSGGMTKGFMVFIKGPDNKSPVKWENWSGGETQRLQLAGDLGLANLIMQQAGLRNTIEFFDEPSTHLSQGGMMDLADLLHERAMNEDKCIWIVDHTSIANFGEFESVITVRKSTSGSNIDIEVQRAY